MLTLGVETSCDDTGVALYCQEKGLLSHVTYSQINEHSKFGGVVPEIASREHSLRIVTCFNKLLESADISIEQINSVSYTSGPGLVGALMVGACFAHSFANARGIEKIEINHLEGHLFSCWLPNKKPRWPCVLLLVSGGHTSLIYAKALGDYTILGETLDDAAGEVLDKTAKLLGLPYPGGAHLSQLATNKQTKSIKLPLPLQNKPGLNFSFSGLKSAAMREWQKCQQTQQDKVNLAASFEKKIIESLIKKTIMALEASNCNNLLLAGGVSANLPLRQELMNYAKKNNINLILPQLEFCTDNGAMIAAAGNFKLVNKVSRNINDNINIKPRWPIDSLK